MVITSLENDKVKELVKLQQKKFRDQTGTYLVEGEHLVEEADKSSSIIEIILLDGEYSEYNYPIITVNESVMKKISSLETAPKIMALCKKNNNTDIVGDRILLLDSIQDPGNLGTMIRSSLAFGVTSIVLSNCVDLYNPKVLRGTQGMIFHIPIIMKDSKSTISYMKDNKIPVYGTSVINGVEASKLSSEEKMRYCLIMGNEGSGLPQEIFDLCDKNLYIPMNEQVESLNVGVACSILLYELGRD